EKIFNLWLDTDMCSPDVWGIDRNIMTSPRITKFIGEVLERHPEKNPLRPDTWNFIRRCIDYAQLIRPRTGLLTQDERLALAQEDTPLTNADFETRRDI